MQGHVPERAASLDCVVCRREEASRRQAEDRRRQAQGRREAEAARKRPRKQAAKLLPVAGEGEEEEDEDQDSMRG